MNANILTDKINRIKSDITWCDHRLIEAEKDLKHEIARKKTELHLELLEIQSQLETIKSIENEQ